MHARPKPIISSQWWQNTSLSTRLVSLVTLMMAWGLALSGVTVLGILQNHMIGQVDAELTYSARRLANSSVRALLQNTTPVQPSNYYVRVELKDSPPTEIVNPSLKDTAGIPQTKGFLEINDSLSYEVTPPVTVPSTEDGVSWRAVAVPLENLSTKEPAGVVTVALPLIATSATLQNTALYVLVSSLALIVTGAAMASYLVRRSLKPLFRIEKVANEIAGGDLSRRITDMPEQTEVGSLARSLNVMLSHIQTAFEAREESESKMRQFISDASHELRTPLSAIRGYGELVNMGAVPEENFSDVMERITSEAVRMGDLVESLLRLARLDEGRKLRFAEIDLIRLAQGAAMDCQALDSDRVVTIIGLDGISDAPDKLVAFVDRDQMTQVFTNLIGNIIRYTPPGTPLEIAIGELPEYRIGVRFIDHGNGLTDEEKQRVFERFYRADKSRSRESGGTGLGLPIVKAIIKAHDGKITMEDTPGGGLTVFITLPKISGAGIQARAKAAEEVDRTQNNVITDTGEAVSEGKATNEATDNSQPLDRSLGNSSDKPSNSE